MAKTIGEPVHVVRVRGLRKQYNGKNAVDGIDLDIERGEVVLPQAP